MYNGDPRTFPRTRSPQLYRATDNTDVFTFDYVTFTHYHYDFSSKVEETLVNMLLRHPLSYFENFDFNILKETRILLSS